MRFTKPLIILSIFFTCIIMMLFFIYRDTTHPPTLTSQDVADKTLLATLQNIADATVEGGAPGIIIHVRENDSEHTVTSGVANKATGQSIATDIPLRIASISKIYTAVVIHELISEGRFSLDTKVKDLLSEKNLQDIPNFNDTTVRQLLQHTSGIADYYDLRSYLFNDWTQPITLNKMLPVIKRHKPTNAPGETYNYSNAGYLLLGEIAEVTSGESMGDLINRVITTPLGLQKTFYNIYQPVEEDIHGYGTYLRPWKDTHEYWEHSGPDGGIMASASDVSAFLQALLIKESDLTNTCLLYTSPSPRDQRGSRMPSSA